MLFQKAQFPPKHAQPGVSNIQIGPDFPYTAGIWEIGNFKKKLIIIIFGKENEPANFRRSNRCFVRPGVVNGNLTINSAMLLKHLAKQ